MKKRWIGFAALACAACCAAPLLLVGGGVGALAAISVDHSIDQWVCGGLLVAMAVGGFFLMRKRGQKNCATTGADSCSTGCDCKTNVDGT